MAERRRAGGEAREDDETAAARGLWWWYLLAGVGLGIAYYLSPPHSGGFPIRVLLYGTISGSAALAVFYGLTRARPGARLPWVLIGISQSVYFTADTLFYVSHYVFDVTTYPAIADPFYIGHFAPAVVGVVMLIRRRTPGRDVPGLLDSASLAVVAAMLWWVYIIGPQTRLEQPLLTALASLGYPVMDLALLTVALGLILGAGARPKAFFLFLGWLALILTADTVYVLQQIAGVYQAGNFIDAIWLSGNLMLGASALHPTMVRIGERAPVREQPLSPNRIALLTAAALLAPAILVVQYAAGSTRDIPVIAGACALLFLLTIVRLAVLVSGQRRLAITDGLTGLHTRRFFEAQLALEVARARRAGATLSVVIIDVDHFKTINDRYGHPAGDRVLIELAARLRSTVRSGEVLARYGGEEFALIVPGADADALNALADRLRGKVADSPIPVSEHRCVPVTVSVGTARFPTHGSDPAELVSIADRALYRAKAAGRDRVESGSGTATARGALELGGSDYLHLVADRVDDMLSDHEHSRAIARWTRVLATEFGYDAEGVDRVELAGRLHDIGKILVPTAVLTKPGRLTDPEWELIRRHPEDGYRLACVVPGHAGVAQVIRQHHERWDGRGYPDRLAGRDIRAEARILAVCDSWAAMRADRPYQAALSEDRAREEIRSGRGTQFDPEVADMFLDMHHRGLVGDLRPLRVPG